MGDSESNLHWRGKGNGALEALVGRPAGPAEIMDYNEHAIGAGTTAKAAAYIELRVDGEPRGAWRWYRREHHHCELQGAVQRAESSLAASLTRKAA